MVKITDNALKLLLNEYHNLSKHATGSGNQRDKIRSVYLQYIAYIASAIVAMIAYQVTGHSWTKSLIIGAITSCLFIYLSNILNGSSTVVTGPTTLQQQQQPQMKDSSLYNYNARHPAHILIEQYGFDTFMTKLNECVSQAKGQIRIQSDKLRNVTNYKLYNYTAITLKEWSEFTILCRGLVIDTINKRLVATPFPKFFNYQEFGPQSEVTKYINQSFSNLKNIKTGNAGNNIGNNIGSKSCSDIQIYEKMDGSLGIMFYCEIKQMWRMNTRGSFASKHAIWATQFINDTLKLHETNKTESFIKGDTYMFEIINSKDFQETIFYKFEGLILLAAYNSQGYEYTWDHLNKIANIYKPHIQMCESAEFSDINAMMDACERLEGDSEGYVVSFDTGLRFKMKGKEYLRLHKLRHGISQKEMELLLLQNGNMSLETLLATMQEEFHELLTKWYNQFQTEKNKVMNVVITEMLDVLKLNLTNKEIGLIIKQSNNKTSKINDTDEKMEENNKIQLSELGQKMIFLSKKILENNNVALAVSNDSESDEYDKLHKNVSKILWNNSQWRQSCWNIAKKTRLLKEKEEL